MMDLVGHLAVAQLFENGEITASAWDRALHDHRRTGLSVLAALLERGEVDLRRVRQVCPNWVDGPRALPGTPTEDLLSRHASPFK